MGKHTDFGESWSDVVEKYYFGKPPSISDNLAWEALGVVERLWPEYIDKIPKNVWGPDIIAKVIDRGVTLAACEKLEFKDLLRKIREGNISALSEAEFAVALVKLGYDSDSIEYEPTNNIGKHPDFGIFVEGIKVYAEVVSPDLSDKTKRTYDEMEKIGNEAMEQNPGVSINIQLDSTKDDISTVDSPILGYAGFKKEDGLITSVNVRSPQRDKRAKWFMRNERNKHFSSNEMNLLVIDISSIPDGIKGWTPLIKHHLRPKLNEELGAVVIFKSIPHNRVILRRWSVLRHPKPYFSLPETLLNGIASLDHSLS